MPLYEYECKQCKRHTEKIQKFSDAEITECPHCGGPLERVVSAPAISFKGGGWFADGYGNAKASASQRDGKGDASAAPSGESSGAPSKDTSNTAPSSGSPAPSAASAPAASSSDKK
jgi:putative FmdB family regulatory protein